MRFLRGGESVKIKPLFTPHFQVFSFFNCENPLGMNQHRES